LKEGHPFNVGGTTTSSSSSSYRYQEQKQQIINGNSITSEKTVTQTEYTPPVVERKPLTRQNSSTFEDHKGPIDKIGHALKDLVDATQQKATPSRNATSATHTSSSEQVRGLWNLEQ